MPRAMTPQASNAPKPAGPNPAGSKPIVCLISGRGSNLEALLRTAREQDWQAAFGFQAAAVVSNQAGAGGLQVARTWGVPASVLPHADFASREAFEAALADRIDGHRPALIVLAGFLRVLTPAFAARYRGRLLNIHPSLLPAFPGLDTHRRALAAGVRLHGATVHFVSDQLDGGPIVAQAAVPVLPGDTEQALAQRVLAQEHLLLPRCVRWILEGCVRLEGDRVLAEGLDRRELLVFAR
jgi:phosphoribosylglycinamide formyltransferase-1